MIRKRVVNFRYGNGGVPCNEPKRIRFSDGNRVPELDTEVEEEYGTARLREELANASLGC